MTTYFTFADSDRKFIQLINSKYPDPTNQPYIFFLMAGKEFYRILTKFSNVELIADASQVQQAYKKAFQSRYTVEELIKMSVAMVGSLPGDGLCISYTLDRHGLEMLLDRDARTLELFQGPIALKIGFNVDGDEIKELYFQ